MSFFEEPQGAAVFKHALLRRYLAPFVTKTGSRSAGGRVAYLDAFAGAGTYEDGSPGSPSLAIETARALSAIRDLRCYFVEADRQNFDRLSALIAESEAAATSEAMRGDATEYLGAVIEKTAGCPMFALLDPFGLGIPFRDLTEQLLARTTWRYGRRQGPVTEVLVNFVHAGVYRNASKIEVRSQDPIQQANARAVVDRVDATLGGSWWQAIWKTGGSTEARVAAIRDAYSEKVVAAAGPSWRSYTVQVQDSWQGRPVYDLILFTQSPHGLWVFNEATSLARQDFRSFCKADLQATLWEPEDEWTSALESNVLALLANGRPVRVFERIEAIFGPTLGFARGTHLRKALRALDKRHAFATAPTGPFEEMVLAPNPDGLPDTHETLSLF